MVFVTSVVRTTPISSNTSRIAVIFLMFSLYPLELSSSGFETEQISDHYSGKSPSSTLPPGKAYSEPKDYFGFRFISNTSISFVEAESLTMIHAADAIGSIYSILICLCL